MHTAVARTSNGAPQISQSEDWIICVWRRVVSQAGAVVFTRAYLRNATFRRSSAWHSHNAAHISVHSTGLFSSRITAQIRMDNKPV